MYRMGQRRKAGAVQHGASGSVAPIASALSPAELFRRLDTDALTGLASLATLGHRLDDIYGHCEALGISPSSTFALFIMDPDLGRRPTLGRDAVRVLVADEASRTFCHGETVAISGDRLIVLAALTAGLARTGLGLVERLQQLAALKDTQMMSWIEPLPDERVDIERFVLELSI